MTGSDTQRLGALSRVLPAIMLLTVVACAVVGVWARFHRLETMPLATDEYYFVTSIDSILESGLPELPGGGYYVRALIPQYLTALFIATFGENGLAYRLQAVLFSLLSLPLLYLYSRQELQRVPATAVVVWLLLSSWAIEFARFARMYSAFQFFALLFVLRIALMYRQRCRLDYWLPIIATLALLSHMLGVLFLPLLFLPFLVRPNGYTGSGPENRRVYLLLTAMPILVAAILTQVNFRKWGVIDALPYDFAIDWPDTIRLPNSPFLDVVGDPANAVLLMGVLALAAAGGLLLTKSPPRRLASEDLICGILLAAAVFHQLVIVLACLFVLVGRFGLLARNSSPGHRRVILFSLLLTAGWLAAPLIVPQWMSFFQSEPVGRLGAWRLTYLGWPDFYSPIFVPWYRELPRLGLWIAVGVAYQLLTKIRRPLAELLINPAVLLVYFLVGLALIRAPYNSTRYCFFIYPLGLAAIGLSSYELIVRVSGRSERSSRNNWLAAAVTLGLFAITTDFNPRHWFGIGSNAVTFRTGIFAARAATWYPRFDFASPGRFLDERLESPGEIVVDGALPVSHDSPRRHAIFLSRQDQRFRIVSRDRGTRELWSRQRLLSTRGDLETFTRDQDSLWLVRRVEPAARGFAPADLCHHGEPDVVSALTSIDNRLEVVHVDLARCQ